MNRTCGFIAYYRISPAGIFREQGTRYRGKRKIVQVDKNSLKHKRSTNNKRDQQDYRTMKDVFYW